jgi:flagellar biosynthetic protein FlhB
MAAEDQDSRTEDPTAKRQGEAERKGNVAISREISFTAMLIAALTALALILPWSAQPLLHLLRGLVQRPESISLASTPDIQALLARVAATIAAALAPVMILFALTGIVTVVAQHGGFLWATERLGLQWNLLNPTRGFSRLFSGRALVEWGKGLFKLMIVTVVTYMVMRPEFDRVESLIGADPVQFLPRFMAILHRLLVAVILAMALIAAADFFYQRWSNWRSLKMTRQEVKDEVKNQDGDPTIKAKQRARRQARARRRMLQAVPKASVVVTNPTHFAVALRYEQGMNAPKLVAKGVDFMARRIRDLARDNGVPIIENPPVARALYAAVEIDEEVPPEHYKAVAEIIGYVMRLKRLKRAG